MWANRKPCSPLGVPERARVAYIQYSSSTRHKVTGGSRGSGFLQGQLDQLVVGTWEDCKQEVMNVKRMVLKAC